MRKAVHGITSKGINKSRTIIAFALLFFLASPIVCQQSDASSNPQTTVVFREIRVHEGHPSSDFEFSTSNYNYRILSNGRGRRSQTSSVRTFNLYPPRGFHLAPVMYFAEYRGDLLLICEFTNLVEGAGFITRLDGRTLRMKWKREIPAFNVGRGLIENGYAYVTAIGFIGKVDLTSGAYVWQHDDLYQESAFGSFELPEIRGDIVTFTETEIYYRPRVASIQVERRSGRVINISH